MQNLKQYFFLFILIPFLLTHCGGTSEPVTTEEDPSESDVVNTEKLVGTPFEGLETGDEFDWDYFLCNQYRTETINSLPIKIFAAFFTESEEEIVQEGIDIANTAMGPTNDGGVFYELSDVWSDDLRVIYRVEDIVREDGYDPTAAGHADTVYFFFNDNHYSERIVTDWSVEILNPSGINKWIVAHELGHTVSLKHYLIDYENDNLIDLEENSLMELDVSLVDPAMDDYNYMMTMQGQIMQNHLEDDTGSGGGGDCSDL